jgi:putative transposase
MHFEEGHIYHIYNQGNNRQTIYFEIENYHFFLKKMQDHLLPHCNILAYCLMPNHFHWMVEVTSLFAIKHAHGEGDTHGVTQSHTVSCRQVKIDLNNSIGILLRSYTRAINKRYDQSGSLFRDSTKAQCLTKNDVICPAFFDSQYVTLINVTTPEITYPQICFNYIHNNPVKARLVSNPGDWEFSSFLDYYGNRKGSLIDKEITKTLIGNI